MPGLSISGHKHSHKTEQTQTLCWSLAASLHPYLLHELGVQTQEGLLATFLEQVRLLTPGRQPGTWEGLLAAGFPREEGLSASVLGAEGREEADMVPTQGGDCSLDT